MAQEPGGPQPVGTRAVGITTALRLSYVSIAWGTLSGATAVAVGIASYSLAVVGIGLNGPVPETWVEAKEAPCLTISSFAWPRSSVPE